MRKRHGAAFKAQVVQEILKEEESIAQIASGYGVDPSQLNTWKAVALKGLPSPFSREHKAADTEQAAHENQVNGLYAEIGRLITQVTDLDELAAGLAGHLLPPIWQQGRPDFAHWCADMSNTPSKSATQDRTE